jgi:hypothetical protein
MLKESIFPYTKADILPDFPKHYVLFEDVIQRLSNGFCWEAENASLHHFIIYYCMSGPEISIKQKCVSVLSANVLSIHRLQFTLWQEECGVVSGVLSYLKKEHYLVVVHVHSTRSVETSRTYCIVKNMLT